MKKWFVHNFLLSIEGDQSKGWLCSNSKSSRELLFNFEIEELENDGGFLLLCFSQNEEVYCDTWHETLEDSIKTAVSKYGISKNLWKKQS